MSKAQYEDDEASVLMLFAEAMVRVTRMTSGGRQAGAGMAIALKPPVQISSLDAV